LDGVVRTRVGYAGGDSDDPTYHNLDSHSETVQMEYDPSKISYNDLLEIFWSSHHPTYLSTSYQYASIIFYHDEEQKMLAIESRDAEEARLGQKIYTQIVPYSKFYLAEDYHQKYYLKNNPELIKAFMKIYPDEAGITNSTAAARINGYLGGSGSMESLQRNLDSFGLTAQGQELLLEIGNSRLMWSQGKSCPTGSLTATPALNDLFSD
jgi:peptide-methionine (S)-S-oxide reductase